MRLLSLQKPPSSLISICLYYSQHATLLLLSMSVIIHKCYLTSEIEGTFCQGKHELWKTQKETTKEFQAARKVREKLNLGQGFQCARGN